MPPREIPGFYYDEAKGKYFSIESRSTAPPAAPWSADNVRKRARGQHRAHRRAGPPACPRLRRSLLEREGGFAGDELGFECEGVVSSGRGPDGKGGMGEARGRVWAGRLGDAGAVRIGDGGLRSVVFEVVTGDVEGLGYVYAVTRHWDGVRNRTSVVGKYIPTDDRGRVCFDIEKTGLSDYPINGPVSQMSRNCDLSSVGYNPHQKVFFASCLPGLPGHGSPLLFSAEGDPFIPGPISSAGLNHSSEVPIRNLSRPVETFASISAPHNSPFTCFVGTSQGAVAVRERAAKLIRPTQPHGSIFALDCTHLDPNLLLTAGRRGIVAATDLRARALACEFRHGTTATHVRIAPDGNEHSVVVAGVSDTMSIYDRRWLGCSPMTAAALPSLTFPAYRNPARTRIGWDLCREAGVVVAAEAGGGVGLYSVFSGRRIGELPLGEDGGASGDDHPVECLRVATVAGEPLPSVFVPLRRGIVKFSCGLGDGDDDGTEDNDGCTGRERGRE
ncbi:uncharacterized protein DNG_06520 [Cephalotrichum gorgonifer]|uniref:WD40 domain-containing protein n=1 Tax=Cephalotrichum gorgonifer TaxID=2041049 RepID=A0AAE8N2Y0_9PEZI|nr:uncharacterized protein DNG_06520 [Cephalotrichum gorgonifer]